MCSYARAVGLHPFLAFQGPGGVDVLSCGDATAVGGATTKYRPAQGLDSMGCFIIDPYGSRFSPYG